MLYSRILVYLPFMKTKTYTSEEVASMLFDIIRAISEGTLRKWSRAQFKAFIQELEQKATSQKQ
jgi:hypothetical protein